MISANQLRKNGTLNLAQYIHFHKFCGKTSNRKFHIYPPGISSSGGIGDGTGTGKGDRLEPHDEPDSGTGLTENV